jgi:hypothetical protein
MVHNIQNHRVYGLCPPSGILNNLKLDLFPSSNESTETPTLLGLSERTNLNHWTMDKVQEHSNSEL